MKANTPRLESSSGASPNCAVVADTASDNNQINKYAITASEVPTGKPPASKTTNQTPKELSSLNDRTAQDFGVSQTLHKKSARDMSEGLEKSRSKLGGTLFQIQNSDAQSQQNFGALKK